MELERVANDALAAERRAAADPDCRICKGWGQTSGHIAPSKFVMYACPCTGLADWQRDGRPPSIRALVEGRDE
jgi:hypothetical protein